MIRPIAALAVMTLLTGTAMAQEAAPATPAPADIVVDPAANLSPAPKQANMLTGFYATQAVIELCSLEIEQPVLDGMAADRARLETALSMDATTAETAYARVKADVETTTPDCTDGSPDRMSVDAVTAIYEAQVPPPGAEAPAAGATPATPATPADPATPAVPAEPATPATPAQ